MGEKIKTACAWLFVCFCLLLGLDNLTGGMLGLGKLLTAAIAPVRGILSVTFSIPIAIIFGLIMALPLTFIIMFLGVKEDHAAGIAVLLGQMLAFGMVFSVSRSWAWTLFIPFLLAGKRGLIAIAILAIGFYFGGSGGGGECVPAGTGIYNDC